jgi:hypothetical protein
MQMYAYVELIFSLRLMGDEKASHQGYFTSRLLQESDVREWAHVHEHGQ